jgi:hypothetical protein
MISEVTKQPPVWKIALTMILNPGLALKNAMEKVPWMFSLSISALAFTSFFLQTGLDLYRTGHKVILSVIILSLLGALYGSVGVALIACIIWVVSKMFGNDKTLKWTVSAFGLSYSSTFIYAFLGLLFSLFLHWRTAVAFGVTGVLWATKPMISTIKELVKGRLGLSVLLATVCGGLLLIGWVFIGNM